MKLLDTIRRQRTVAGAEIDALRDLIKPFLPGDVDFLNISASDVFKYANLVVKIGDKIQGQK